jgi:heavy metal sensor kinase
MRAFPIRLRLTSWYFVMFATAGILLSLTSWWMLRHTLDATIGQDLQERVDDIRVQLSQIGSNISLHDAQERFLAIYQERDDGKWLQIVDESGRVLFRSTRMAPLPEPLDLPQPLPSNGVITDVRFGAHAVRFLCVVVDAGGRTFRIDTGISMTKPRALLRRFGLGLLLLTPLVFVLSAAGGHLMSRKALAPVGLIAHEARRITDRNLKNRLPVPAGNDELSHLSITLNHMLTRIDGGFRSVRDFTANASHELRTPLARLRAEVEIALLRTRSAAEYRQALERVQEDALDMSSLVDNLLTLARAEAGRETTELSAVDVESLIDTSVKEWSPIAERLGVRLLVRTPQQEKHLFVVGDRLSLLRLLRIWLDNACKFTPVGGTVTFSASEDADEVLLAVEDTGIGIAAEHHTRVFERFYRVPSISSHPNGGAGLGLSLAAWIAEQHGTRIVLESAPGRGSRFQVRLPAIKANKNASFPPPPLLRSGAFVHSEEQYKHVVRRD